MWPKSNYARRLQQTDERADGQHIATLRPSGQKTGTVEQCTQILNNNYNVDINIQYLVSKYVERVCWISLGCAVPSVACRSPTPLDLFHQIA